MRVEVLYFDGCPTCVVAEWALREVLAEQGIEAEVDLVAVNSDEEAQRLRFPGSPTIRVNGEVGERVDDYAYDRPREPSHGRSFTGAVPFRVPAAVSHGRPLPPALPRRSRGLARG